MKQLALAICTLFAATLLVTAATDIRELHDELEAGRITLDSAVGNGSSSGAAVSGSLHNQSDAATHVAVYLAKPIYLENSSSRQNMVAAQVYLANGGYRSDGRRAFITLPAHGRTRVQFMAYCADFAKDNPSQHDSFTVAATPPILARTIANINAYAAQHPEADITCAAQVAIWLAQGEAPLKIRAKFTFNAEDEALARSWLPKTERRQ